jgi:predicted Zn-dependent peptidase
MVMVDCLCKPAKYQKPNKEHNMPALQKTITVHGAEIPVIFEQDTYLPLMSMQLIFEDSGALSDLAPGQAKMTARLLGEGSRRDGATKFAQRLESRAVSLNAHAGRETLVVELGALAEEFGDGIGLLAELLSDPNYSPEAFETIQAATLGRLTQKQSDFDYLASVALKGVLFAGTPQADPADGTLHSIKTMDPEDLVYHFNAHVGLSNLTVVLGGAMDWEKVEPLIRQALTPLKQNSVVPIGHFKAISTPATHRQSAQTEQAYIYFGAPYDVAYDGDETHLAKVAGFVLGSSGFGSRLMEEIRVKRGLAYSAYGRFALNRSVSYFTGHLQTKLESEEEAIAVVREVVGDFVRDGMTAKELEGAKQFLLGSEPLRTETLSQRLGRAFNEYYAHKPLGDSLEELKRIEALTLDEVNDFIRKHEEISALSFSIVGK